MIMHNFENAVIYTLLYIGDVRTQTYRTTYNYETSGIPEVTEYHNSSVAYIFVKSTYNVVSITRTTPTKHSYCIHPCIIKVDDHKSIQGSV